MRIVIDMQGAQTPFSRTRGVGRYTLGLVKAFLKIAASKHDVFLVLNGSLQDSIDNLRAEFSELLPIENIKCWQQYLSPVSGSSGNILARKASEFVREWYIGQLNADIVWSTNLQEGWFDNAVTSVKEIDIGAVYCSTLHDVIPLLFPEKYLTTNIKYWYQDKIEFAIKSDILLTVSNYSKKKIIELLKIDASKVFAVENSFDSSVFYPISRTGLTCQNPGNLIPGSYILYVGGADLHKNLPRLISAYSLLNREIRKKYKIVFVGREVKALKNQLLAHASTLGIKAQQLVFLGFVSDLDLAELYRNCTLFIFPSYSEGFGIPPLEAMACGCPVIAANAASLPEIVGLSEALFDPYNEQDMAAKMASALTDAGYKELLVKNGLARAKAFSWETSSQKILDIFEQVRPYKIETSSPIKRHITGEPSFNYQKLIDKLATIPGLDESQVNTLAQSIADSMLPCDSTRNLYIDLSCLVHSDDATGIQRVARAITQELHKIPLPGIRVSTVFSYAGHRHFYRAEEKNEKYYPPDTTRLCDYVVDFNDGDILLFLDLHPGSAISKKDEIRRLRNAGVRVYFVVYDLLPISHPQFFFKELVKEFKEWIHTVSLSDGAICISQDVANKVKNWIRDNVVVPSKLFRVNYFHLGADIQNSVPSKGLPSNAEVLLDLFKNSVTFLMVGTIEPRKGHKFVLDAFDLLWRNGVHALFVIVGRAGWWCNAETIDRIRKHSENGNRLFWLEGISDEFLEKVYAASTCLIAASEDEGFGLSLIEAAQHKLPIIARDIQVFREVAGEYAFYYKDNKPDSLSETIKKWLELYSLGQHPKSDHVPWITWKDSAQQLLNQIGLIP